MNEEINTGMEPGNPEHIAKVRELIAERHQAMLSEPHGLPPVEIITRRNWDKWLETLTGRLNLNGADFSGLGIAGCDFRNAQMVGTSFEDAVLYRCSFRGADLRKANFRNAKCQCLFEVQGANFAGACFAGAVIQSPVANERTDFTDADFSGCKLKDGKTFRKFLSDPQKKQLIGTCFIATAACGDEYAPAVSTLQEFRDSVLVRFGLGRQFIRAYYRASPPVADFIAGRPFLRHVVRDGFIRPIAFLVQRMSSSDQVSKRDSHS